MKKLRRKFWGRFEKKSRYNSDVEVFENFIDEFVEISHFDNISELEKVYDIEFINFEGIDENFKGDIVLLENPENYDDFIVTSTDIFVNDKVKFLNDIIGRYETTTKIGNEPIYKLIKLEVVR